MKHQVSGKKLNRTKKHREALFANLISSLIEHGKINTTQAKAKAVQGQVEKLITKAKSATVSNRRELASVFGKRQTANHLVEKTAKDAADRTSGFTRIISLGERQGDNAMMARLELVDFKLNAKPVETKKETAKPAAKKAKVSTKQAAKKE